MTPAQKDHMNTLVEKFREMHTKKYEAGQEEHGGNLWQKDLMWVIQAAKEEVIDQWAYLDVIERQVGRLYEVVDKLAESGKDRRP
jgi:uncharacterized coiled-coil protein SlyX